MRKDFARFAERLGEDAATVHEQGADMPDEVLGIDIGGVIIRRFGDRSDTSFQKDFLKTPAVEGALETIRHLVDRRFGPRVHLVSKCGA
ncbi:MAG TPA: hypothetical protein VG943_05890, partial [Caulobacterales bacterium]|nr:hypothetical protein [Caulobacterales bacterium]